MSYHKVHPKFKFNGHAYQESDLKELGYSLVKEGEDFEKIIGNFLLDWCDGSPMISVHTSGSTGTPKKVFLEKIKMCNSAKATGGFFNLGPGTKALHCMPSSFIAGKMMLVRAMVLGWEITCVLPSSKPSIPKGVYYDFSAMIPLQLENSLDKISQIGVLIIGGAPMSIELKNSVQHLQTHIYETYGMTETITHIAAKRINDTAREGRGNFIALPQVSLATDNRNCLVIDAPQISNEKVMTNDVVNLVSDTEFQWLGRFDNIINSGGIKLVPEQIEAKLSELISERFFVAGIPDKTLGQKLVLVIEGNRGVETLWQGIKSLHTLSKFEIPKEIFSVNEFVETKNGKVQRIKTLHLAMA
ncbi:AMP-binding protein [Arenibacter sp. 6A1]|uniref:AMP-binding protein n=1 Tax=Arenibacter sp. 6A1 TaxID=2720391 RepID=UPI001F0F7DCF|nr:AMP-binding protein [Arenibacter sp. 6A1]